jgi:hypothetical protein
MRSLFYQQETIAHRLWASLNKAMPEDALEMDFSSPMPWKGA